MINYKYFRFAAPPRTGSTWVMKAAELAGLGHGSKTHLHVPFRNEKDAILRVSMVRNPVTWLQSYYQSIRGGSISVPVVDVLTKLDFSEFDTFVDSYLEQTSGALGRIVEGYYADTYLRMEDLPWSFIELVETVQPLYPSGIKLLPSQNISNTKPYVTEYQRKAILEAESELVERFEY